MITLTEHDEDVLNQHAFEAACEIESPNAPGFDRLQEQIYEGLCVQRAYNLLTASFVGSLGLRDDNSQQENNMLK